jgi:Methylamine utilisation protein MauE
MTATWVVGSVRLAVGITLAVAAVWKARDFASFRAGLAAYGLRGPVGRLAALAVIGAEAVTAGLTIAPVGDPLAGLSAAGLGLVFLASQVYALSTGAEVPCLCFGRADSEPVSARSFVRAALVLIAGLIVLFAGASTRRPLDGTALVAAIFLVGGCWIVLRRRAPGGPRP